MKYFTSLKEKTDLIHHQFSALIGKEILGYELAQIWCEETAAWSEWNDLPVFLLIGSGELSISWQKFDELAIEVGRVLPFSLCGSTVRWINSGNIHLDTAIGRTVESVSLAQGEMTVGGSEIEIWTRLLIHFTGGGSLEVYNALDENGFELHTKTVEAGVSCF
jgi:hypothetical protein